MQISSEQMSGGSGSTYCKGSYDKGRDKNMSKNSSIFSTKIIVFGLNSALAYWLIFTSVNECTFIVISFG